MPLEQLSAKCRRDQPYHDWRLYYSTRTQEEYDASRASSTHHQQQQPAPSWKRRTSETIVMPIVIIDAILPGQTLHFTSPDPKFDALINYVLSSHHGCQEIGIIGVDPPTKHPLYVGVTAPIVKKDVVFGIDRNSERVLATSLKGTRRFRIVGEPWMDPTESFYIGQVQILDHRDEPVPLELQPSVHHLHSMIPALVNEWVESLIKTEKLSPAGVTTIIKEIGPMPSSPCDRAMWVGALLNPILPIGICQEIRPAMLLCQNDYDRLVLATVALRSTVDTLLKGKD